MVNNYRVAPASTVQPIVVQPTSSPLSRESRSGALRRRHKQCLVIVAVVITLVVALAVGAVVVVWLTLGSALFGKGATNSSNDTQWDGTVKRSSHMHSLNENSTPSYVLSHTIIDYIDLPENSRDPAAVTVTTKRISADSEQNFPPCPSTNQIQCRSDGTCIPRVKRCNKVKDCPDASDEFNCTCTDVLLSTSPSKVCDGYADCPNEEDEKGCAYQCRNASSRHTFRCSMSGDCIPLSAMCDGKRDCPDGQDERDCWMLSPNVDSAISHSHRSYYDFGYVFRRRNGMWSLVSSEEETASLGRLICEQVQYRSLLYSALRPITDNRINGCFIATGNLTTSSALESALQFKPSCPNRMALYLACDDFVCGRMPDCRPARTRVVGGASTGAFCNPWTVALYRDGEMSCQAVVLNHLWLLTAAHCFKKQFSWSPYTLARNVVAAIRHPNFTDTSVETHDIALIRLDRPVSYSAAVQPPCLARAEDNPQDGEMCTVLGWGYMVEDGLQFADELRQVDLNVISNQRCNASPAFFRGHINDGHLCLGHGLERKDACQGDSGGPLLCARGVDRSHYLAGITSTGDGCARANIPGIWTRLSVYIDWIKSTLSSNSSQVVSQSTPLGPDRPCTGFQCATGECVYSFFRCDGGWDCQVDGSDELYCSHDAAEENTLLAQETDSSAVGNERPSITTQCGDENNDGYLCPDGVTCLPYYQRCDYVKDCPGGEDEDNCFYCLDTDISCDDNRRCLPFSTATASYSNATFSQWMRDRFDCKGLQ